MKGNTLQRIKECQKWKDIVNFSCMECQVALFLTLIVIIVLQALDVYENFSIFEECFKNISIYIAAALIGMLGLVLSGIAIIIGVLDKAVTKKIKELNGEESINRILLSFEFIAFNIGLLIVIFFLVYVFLFSDKVATNVIVFYAVVAILSYWFVFTVFYVVSLTGNCIKVFHISNTYNNVIQLEQRQLNEVMNEIRIDFILKILQEHSDVAPEKFLQSLLSYVKSIPINEQDRVIEYFKKHYKVRD